MKVPNVFIRDAGCDKEQARTLKEVIEQFFKEGRIKEIVGVVKNLPPEKKEKYKKFYKELQDKKRNGAA